MWPARLHLTAVALSRLAGGAAVAGRRLVAPAHRSAVFSARAAALHAGRTGPAALLTPRHPTSLLPATAAAASRLGGVAGMASKASKKKKGGGRDRDEERGSAPSTSTSSPAAGGGIPTSFNMAAITASMARAVDHLTTELAGLRTGRASPGMLDNLDVPGAYGSAETSSSSATSHSPPLRALAATTARDAHTLVVTPFDPSTLPALEAALRDGPLSLNPTRSPGGELIVPVPPPTKDAAVAMLKVARAAAENARAAVRQARRGGMEAAKAAHAGEDDRRVAEKKVQAATDEATASVDKLLAAKEKALAEV